MEGKGLINFLKRRVNSYPPNVEKVLKQYGNEQITSLTLLRTPVPELLIGTINAVSFGSFNKQRGNTVLYHLRMDIGTSKGKVSLEKNERINMEINPKVPPNTETMEISPIPALTINQLLDNTQNKMGSDFFTYQSKGNNCQVFILNALLANNIDSPQYNSFVKQDTSGYFNDSLRKITNTVTDIGALANVLRQGGSLTPEQNHVIKFNKINWGSFTKQFKEFKSKNRQEKRVKDLEDFAHLIMQYPYKFSKVSKERAEFYLHVLEHRKLQGKISQDNNMGRRKQVVGGDLGDDIRGAFERAGEVLKPATLGINPAKILTASYDLGHDVIGPAIAHAMGHGVHIHHHHYHPMPAELMNGEGLFDIAKKVGKFVAPKLIDAGANKLKDIAGNNSVANTIVDAGANMAKSKIDGMGIKKPRNVNLKVHGRTFKTMAEKMAYLRSLRKK
jgi:hypothetical protein